jgi:mycothiol system anti-sigma-R factor
MDCRTASALIDAYLDGELDRAEARALEAHLDACPACAAALAESDALRRALRDPALRQAAPQELRERVQATLTQSATSDRTASYRPRSIRPAWWQLAAACVVAFAAGASLHVLDRNTTVAGNATQLSRDLFASHWRALAAASPFDVASSDRHTVKPWFAGRVAQSPLVRDFADQGFALAGGRIDYVGDERVAVLVYRHGRHWIDVFVLPAADAGALGTIAQRQGYTLETITLGGQPAAIVTDMDAQELANFAGLLQR